MHWPIGPTTPSFCCLCPAAVCQAPVGHILRHLLEHHVFLMGQLGVGGSTLRSLGDLGSRTVTSSQLAASSGLPLGDTWQLSEGCNTFVIAVFVKLIGVFLNVFVEFVVV